MSKKEKKSSDKEEKKISEYDIYPENQDIYSDNEEAEFTPEELPLKKTPNENPDKTAEKDFVDSVSGYDIDIPESELDAKEEKTGSEEEEKKPYSFEGDNSKNTEEDKEYFIYY